MTKIIRQVKNIINNFTVPEVKVREATSNDPWFAPMSVMHELVQHTYNPTSLQEMVQILLRRLNDVGKNWRHIYKSLVVFEYLALYGSEAVYQIFRSTRVQIETLKSFTYIDRDGRDQGASVRERCQRAINLIKNEAYFHEQRAKAAKVNKNQDGGIPSFISSAEASSLAAGYNQNHGGSSYDNQPFPSNPQSNLRSDAPKTQQEEDYQLRLALAISKEESENVFSTFGGSQANERRQDQEFDPFSSKQDRPQSQSVNPYTASRALNNKPSNNNSNLRANDNQSKAQLGMDFDPFADSTPDPTKLSNDILSQPLAMAAPQAGSAFGQPAPPYSDAFGQFPASNFSQGQQQAPGFSTENAFNGFTQNPNANFMDFQQGGQQRQSVEQQDLFSLEGPAGGADKRNSIQSFLSQNQNLVAFDPMSLASKNTFDKKDEKKPTLNELYHKDKIDNAFQPQVPKQQFGASTASVGGGSAGAFPTNSFGLGSQSTGSIANPAAQNVFGAPIQNSGQFNSNPFNQPKQNPNNPFNF